MTFKFNFRIPFNYHYYPNVGSIQHEHRLNGEDSLGSNSSRFCMKRRSQRWQNKMWLFNKWSEYPKEAHKLYWRLHPEEVWWKKEN